MRPPPDRSWLTTETIREERHRTTDPACVLHEAPRTRWARWRFERGRGRPCPVCFPRDVPMPRAVVMAHLVQAEHVLRAMGQAQTADGCAVAWRLLAAEECS